MLSVKLLFEYSYQFIFHKGNEQLIIKVWGENPLWFQGYTTNVLLLFILDHLHDGNKSVKNMPMCFFNSVHLLPQIIFDFPLMIIIFTYINMAENIIVSFFLGQ